jgi:hypothetical protein
MSKTKFVTSIVGRGGNLKIVIKSPESIYEQGRRVGTIPGKYADFKGGLFETSDLEVIEKLRNNKKYGISFYEVPSEIGEQKEEVKTEKKVNLRTMTRPELKAMAEENGIEVKEEMTKSQIIDLLK